MHYEKNYKIDMLLKGEEKKAGIAGCIEDILCHIFLNTFL